MTNLWTTTGVYNIRARVRNSMETNIISDWSTALMVNARHPVVAGDFDDDGLADPAMVAADGVWTIWMSCTEYAAVSTIPLTP